MAFCSYSYSYSFSYSYSLLSFEIVKIKSEYE